MVRSMIRLVMTGFLMTAVLGAALSLGGCNTVKGMGEDIGSVF